VRLVKGDFIHHLFCPKVSFSGYYSIRRAMRLRIVVLTAFAFQTTEESELPSRRLRRGTGLMLPGDVVPDQPSGGASHHNVRWEMFLPQDPDQAYTRRQRISAQLHPPRRVLSRGYPW
jgi:hypothetical protein